jgi:NAD-dependent DNA ligase adenylation domain/NAD-dependent DNA ligase OB-fold domain
MAYSIASSLDEAQQRDHTGQPLPPTQGERLRFLQRSGFKIDPQVKLLRSVDEVIRFVEHAERRSTSGEYDTDGVVVKVDQLEVQAQLGNRSTSPRWAVAYKFSAERIETRICDIRLQVGRSGKITPVADLKPVTLGGVQVSRATLHNFSFMQRTGNCLSLLSSDLDPHTCTIAHATSLTHPLISSARHWKRHERDCGAQRRCDSRYRWSSSQCGACRSRGSSLVVEGVLSLCEGTSDRATPRFCRGRVLHSSILPGEAGTPHSPLCLSERTEHLRYALSCSRGGSVGRRVVCVY